MQPIYNETTIVQNVFRIVLGAFMVYAAIGHFTFGRKAFQAQVPDWVPMKKDTVVILSGVAELLLGLAMLFAFPDKVRVGIALAVFYVLIFPGNIAQYLSRNKAFGLKTDKSRFIRLFFQPVLIWWALWSTGALQYLLERI
ncbi:MAG TPA: hypothetical protein VF141_07850 [Chryseolinea sp.]